MSNIKKALIVGGEGFVGGHLASYLLSLGYDVAITVYAKSSSSITVEGLAVYEINILDTNKLLELFSNYKPDYIFHLAAQSSIALSWKDPALTIDVNIKGTVNILEALRACKLLPRILLIGSAEEYGHIDYSSKVSEDTICRPTNIYSVTKLTQEMLAQIYMRAYDMKIVLTRSFNHFGIDQSPNFVIADFCSQVAKIEKGLQEPIISVGNIDVYRDFTDVRDVVVAYELLITKGTIGDIYNVGSGSAVKISDILDMILSLSKTKIQVVVDKSKLRPIDTIKIEANISKIMRDTNWELRFNLPDSIKDILDYWRK